MESRKQDDICGFGVPALNMVGEACVNHRSDMRLYVSSTAPKSPTLPSCMPLPCTPHATRMIICCGRSTILPASLVRYERSSVLNAKKS